MTKAIIFNTLETAINFFNNGDLEGYFNTLYAPNVIFHYFPPGLPQGLEGASLYYGAFLQGFPDAVLHIEDRIYEDERVAIRYRLDATHLGEFNGIPASGKQISMNGITIMRWQDGQVVERWSEADTVGLLQQIGAMPAPEAA